VHFFAAIEYAIELSNSFRLVPRGEVEHNSTIYFDASNNPLLAQGPYTLANASLRLENVQKHYDISAWVKNLSNQKYSTDALDLSNFGFDITIHGAPRTYGVSLNYHFE
jgi:iron complex outermembrane receptor protein